ncbi:MAG TPA: bacteriohopanetetrol glucosamine biosynthesis glycosyltransferase HpnI [Caulobacteraceae bacterium]|nr:bacteriohopanetetrol glucosamine biosynthesis glycosyltransferase HpnI [Caulobacteraceae bacterium]
MAAPSGEFAILWWLGLVCLGLSLCGAIYACAADIAVRRFLRRPLAEPASFPSVCILKPLHGDEPGLYENLQSLCVQDYPGPVQMVMGIQNPNDPAIKVVRALQAAYPLADLELVIDPTAHGANRKVSNLINMAPRSHAEVLVISDSDVRAGPGHLREVVAALEKPKVGLVTCLYRGRSVGGLWSTLAAMDVNYRFTPSVVMGFMLGIARPCLGPTMALRRSLLDEIGGFHRVSNLLADDYELGRAVRDQGYEVVFPPSLIEHVCPEASAREMLVHELRWARTVGLIEPVGYVGSAITHFLPLALIGSAFMGFTGGSLEVLAAVLLIRLGLVLHLGRMIGSDRSAFWLAPFRDLLSFGVFITAFLGDRVEWRGTRLRVRRDGAMIDD